jgi:hypothetical protein
MPPSVIVGFHPDEDVREGERALHDPSSKHQPPPEERRIRVRAE